MSDIRVNSLAFTRGIESITHANQDTDQTLPELGNAPPTDVGMRGQLDQLLQKPSLDSRLDQFLRPTLENRDLLMPARFQEALGAARQRLGAAAQRQPEGSEPARLLGRAERLLHEETQLSDLLRMYRSALYQG